MIKIKWSKSAIESIKEISNYIAEDSPFYANLFADRIFELVRHLTLFPEMGRHVPESDDNNVKEIIFKGYRIIYQIKKDYLEIIIVIHGSKLLKL